MATALSPRTRKIVYAVAFEALGIGLGGAILHLLSQAPLDRSLALAAIGAVLALGWSYAFNTAFEAWEARQTIRGRSFRRRSAHALLFEAGLTLLLVPVGAWWLQVTLWAALLYELSLIAAYLVYAWAFTWAFDRIFGLPESAR